MPRVEATGETLPEPGITASIVRSIVQDRRFGSCGGSGPSRTDGMDASPLCGGVGNSATRKRKEAQDKGYEPTIKVATRSLGDAVEIPPHGMIALKLEKMP